MIFYDILIGFRKVPLHPSIASIENWPKLKPVPGLEQDGAVEGAGAGQESGEAVSCLSGDSAVMGSWPDGIRSFGFLQG